MLIDKTFGELNEVAKLACLRLGVATGLPMAAGVVETAAVARAYAAGLAQPAMALRVLQMEVLDLEGHARRKACISSGPRLVPIRVAPASTSSRLCSRV